jgi:hypothetical protein
MTTATAENPLIKLFDAFADEIRLGHSIDVVAPDASLAMSGASLQRLFCQQPERREVLTCACTIKRLLQITEARMCNVVTVESVVLQPHAQKQGHFTALVEHLLLVDWVDAVLVRSVVNSHLKAHMARRPGHWICQDLAAELQFAPSFARFKQEGVPLTAEAPDKQ